MIFELFIAFIFLALVMVFIGYYTDIKVLAILGFVTIFLLGLTLNLSGLSSKTGETTSYSYINTTLTSSAVVYDYTAMTDSASVWIGRWLMIVSVLSASLVFTSNRIKNEDDD